MAIRFSEKERGAITLSLLQAARAHAIHDGMRKTTVDELAAEAGISKGAFYRFYPSKEHLFLDMLEHCRRAVAQTAKETMRHNAALSNRARVAATLKATTLAMRESPLAKFMQQDVPLLLRKMPEALLSEHFQSDEDFVRTLIRDMGVRLTVSEEVASAAVRILFLSQLTAEQAGAGYAAAIDALIDGAVAQFIEE